MSRLVVMGSGETAPTMLRVHRQVFAETPDGPAAMLDTTFGFQLNADELVARTRAYFADSVGRTVELAGWRHRDLPTVAQEKSLALLQRASWIFAGPGSPTYALRQWRDTPVPGALLDAVRRGGTVVFGSAAAVTLGSHAIPVYEIYKAGLDPSWAEGLDLLGALTGIAAVVVPHYDNSEGGSHDTRFCYLGEPRLALLEELLPEAVGVLGVDEHTALLVDVGARLATVAGNGVVTVRRRGRSREFGAGTQIALDDLAGLLSGAERVSEAPPVVPASSTAAAVPAEPELPTSLRAAADAARAGFDEAIARRDVDGCVAHLLELDDAIAAWSTDMLQSDDTAYARRVLRSLVVRLGALAEVGARDPREAVAPYVDLLLALRASARDARDFATSDLVRDRLAEAGVEVRDTPEGASWHLH